MFDQLISAVIAFVLDHTALSVGVGCVVLPMVCTLWTAYGRK